MANDLYMSFSSRARSPMAKPTRRTLTPSTVIPPSLSAGTPAMTKPVTLLGPHSRASSMLARVVSTPSSPRYSSPIDPLHSPGNTSSMSMHYSSSPETSEKSTSRPPMMRFATMPAYSQQNGGGYVSFPDFDSLSRDHKSYTDASDRCGHNSVQT